MSKLLHKLPKNRDVIYSQIDTLLANNLKGRFFSIDLTNFANAYFDNDYSNILCRAELLCVDSEWLPILYYKYGFENSRLTEIFNELIINDRFTHLIIGGPLFKLRNFQNNSRFVNSNIDILEVPFLDVKLFDYKEISRTINNGNYDFIWVSLGAPKQEIFISTLFPHVNKGILVGFGYLLDINSGLRNAPEFVRYLKMEWLFRLCQQPKKQFGRLRLIFKLFLSIFNLR